MAPSEALGAVVLGPDDVPEGLALSDAAGWNQTADDWRLFVREGRVFGLREDGTDRLVATAAALPYGGGLGWVSMVLVAPEWRHQGLATALMEHCVVHLRALNATPVLDATPAGQPAYARLGVKAQISGQEAPTALLSDTTLAGRLFGYPLVPVGAMLDWVADWVKREQPAHNKPTKFEVRDGAF